MEFLQLWALAVGLKNRSRRQGKLDVAARCAVEPLERRVLMDASPVISISPNPVNAGSSATLSMASNDSTGEGIDHWVINYGDGSGMADPTNPKFAPV